MLEDSARTGYMDVILAIVGIAILPFNIEVAFVVLVWSMYIAVANRLPSFYRLPLPTKDTRQAKPQSGKPRTKPRARRTQRRKASQ